MVQTLPVATPPRSMAAILCRCLAITVLALFALPAFSQSCPTGQRSMVFPPEGHFEYWRHTSTGVDRTVEEWWYSESRGKRRERLPFTSGTLDEYFDFAAQTFTQVTVTGGTVTQCVQFPISQTFSRPSIGTGCFEHVSDENLGGLLPVERWYQRSGITVTMDVIALRLGEDLLPLQLFNRQSATIYTAYMNFSAEIEYSDFSLPCTPTLMSGSLETALRDAEIQLGLPAGTLTNPGTGG